MAGKLFTVSTLKQVLKGGAKVDKYTIDFGTPSGNGVFTLGETGIVLCKSASFPDVKIGTVDAWVQGRKLILPGDTAYTNTWAVDFYQTADHNLRQMYINWMKSIDNYIDNNHTCTPADWSIEAVVMQLACDGNPSAKYRFFNMFPTEVSEVKVDGSQINAIQEFTVTFSFSHWDIEKV